MKATAVIAGNGVVLPNDIELVSDPEATSRALNRLPGAVRTVNVVTSPHALSMSNREVRLNYIIH